MPRRRHSIRMRLALATAALVAATGALAIGGVYVVAVARLRQGSAAEAQGELESLLARWRSGGIDALVGEVGRRAGDPASQRFAYLVAEERSIRVAGNVRSWPPGIAPEGGADTGRDLGSRQPVPLEVQRSDVWLVRSYHLELAPLDARRSLLVGRDVSEEDSVVSVLRGAAAGGVALSLILAIGAGLAMSRRLLARVEEMRATIAAIRRGERHGRVSVSGRGDEFDELAQQFNGLLDENERLVTQVRGVTNDIAHDLRTPLQRMRGHLEAALSAPATPPDARRVLEALAADTDRLLETFNGLLQLARLESDELRQSMRSVDLEALVREVAELYAPLAEEAGLALRLSLEPGLQAVADRELLAQAVANLIDNAIKYGGGEAIDVGARRSEDGSVEIAVADRGPGIPEAAREQVLGRLVRLDASRGVPGTGLGLSLVASVARLHGGRIELGENRPGLRAVLRLSDDPRAPAAKAPGPGGPPDPRHDAA